MPGGGAWAAALLEAIDRSSADVTHLEVGDDGAGGTVVEFVLRTGTVLERNAHRYLDHPLGTVLLGIVRRGGPEEPASRPTVLEDLDHMDVPPLR